MAQESIFGWTANFKDKGIKESGKMVKKMEKALSIGKMAKFMKGSGKNKKLMVKASSMTMETGLKVSGRGAIRMEKVFPTSGMVVGKKESIRMDYCMVELSFTLLMEENRKNFMKKGRHYEMIHIEYYYVY